LNGIGKIDKVFSFLGWAPTRKIRSMTSIDYIEINRPKKSKKGQPKINGTLHTSSMDAEIYAFIKR